MLLVLNEDQTMLARTAREFVASTEPLARLRKLRDGKDPLAFSPDAWKKIVDLGWTGMAYPEADGGLGLGLADVVVVTEALGRLLAPEPFIPCAVLAGGVLSLAASAEQKETYLAPTIAGTTRLALASEEQKSRANLRNVTVRAESSGGGFRITGEKTPVLGGHGADTLVVSARTSGKDDDAEGITLFVLPAKTSGVSVVPLNRVDTRNAASVRLQGVSVPASAVVGKVGGALPVLEAAVDRATVALAGEMLGTMSETFERTVAYLREREQFGAKLGSFQALQHRAARLFVEIELTRSTVMAAARAVDENAPSAAELVSVAKARASDALSQIANEAIQMFGGIGMTDEHDIGFFLKRAKVAELTFGDGAFHRARFAALRGF
ncbi:MAG TPA: acyl-CoA dehydrogenase [Polyangiaceae bacterium]|jgi:acyl-CoA dehydrogenase|nr:acyl-CoA dehydrogenase [Polyangiaceae bacterium]